jgi:hypothetical protein
LRTEPRVGTDRTGKTNLILRKSKQFLAQPIPVLHKPFVGQEGFDLLAALDEAVAVTPDTVGCVGEGDALCVSGWALGSIF